MSDDPNLLARITTVQGHDIEVGIDGAEGIAFWIMDHTDEEWIAFGLEDGRELYAALQRFYADPPEGVVEQAERMCPVGDAVLVDGICPLDPWHTDPVVTLGPDGRNRLCVQRWPEAQSCDYDPRCCRFPKSCSAG